VGGFVHVLLPPSNPSVAILLAVLMPDLMLGIPWDGAGICSSVGEGKAAPPERLFTSRLRIAYKANLNQCGSCSRLKHPTVVLC